MVKHNRLLITSTKGTHNLSTLCFNSRNENLLYSLVLLTFASLHDTK